MSQCIVRRVTEVEEHPRGDRPDLNIVRTGELQWVSQKTGETHDTPRYRVGDLVVCIGHKARLPAALQERLGARDPVIRRGNMAGSRTEGMLMPAEEVKPGAAEGEDVTEILGIAF